MLQMERVSRRLVKGKEAPILKHPVVVQYEEEMQSKEERKKKRVNQGSTQNEESIAGENQTRIMSIQYVALDTM